MTELVLWAFLAIAQVEGFVGGAAQTQELCEEARQEALTSNLILAISPCAPVTLTKPVTPRT